MPEQFARYNIENLYDRNHKPLDFEILTFDKPETLLNATAKSKMAKHHMHSFYSIIWLDKGNSKQSIDSKLYEQKENNLLFICPGQIHINDITTSDVLVGGIILFSPDFFTLLRVSNTSPLEINFLDHFYSNPLLALPSSDYTTVRQTIQSLVGEHKHQEKNSLILQSLLFALIMQIERFVDTELENFFPKQSINIYKQFTALLEKNYKNNLSIEDYANKLNLSSRHLNRLIKETTGNSTSSIIKQRQVLEAKRLLLYTSLSISEIGSQLGYLDNSYFNKVFKKETGTTPKAFRIKMSE